MPSFSPEMSTGGTPSGVSFVPADVYMPPPGGKRFYSADLKSQLTHALPDTFVLFEDHFGHIAPHVTSAHFNEISGFELTREESRRGVRFGELILDTFKGGEQTAHVAVKPFDRPIEAASEAGAMLTLNSLSPNPSRPLSYTPLGFLRDHHGDTHLITNYDPTVITQDTVFWGEQPPTDQEAEQALSDAGVALGGLHHHGFSHGDAQVKNVAADLRGVRYVDLESLRHLKGHAGEQMRDDLRTYLGSLTARAPGDVSPFYYDAMVRDVFVPLYRSAIDAEESKVPTESRLRADEVAELGHSFI